MSADSKPSLCPLCVGPRRLWLVMPIDAKTYAPTRFGNVTRCDVCGLGGVDPLPDPSEVPAFYRLDAYYTQGQSHFADGGRPTLIDRLRTHIAWRFDRGAEQTPALMLARLGRAPSAVSVLDIGCGAGERLAAFVKEGCAGLGLDPDETAAERGRSKGLDIRIGTAERAAETLAGRTFDLIVMSHALEHCVDPIAALGNVRRLLRDDGLFYCEVPNCAALHFETFNIVSEMFDAPRHLWFFEPRGLRRALEAAGLAVEADIYHGFTRRHAGAWRATENRIRDRLLASGLASSPLPPPHSRAQSTRLLARSLLAPAMRKYDCAGVYARAAAR